MKYINSFLSLIFLLIISHFLFFGNEISIDFSPLFLDDPQEIKGNAGNPPYRTPRDFFEWCIYAGISGVTLIILWRLFIKGDWGKIADIIRDFFGGGGTPPDIGGTPAA